MTSPMTADPDGTAAAGPPTIPRRRVVSWALWDWGSAAFNAVVTTFVFSTYLASGAFVDPDVVAAAGDDARNPALVLAKAENATVVSGALTIAGVLIAVLAPVLGQRSDGSGRRKTWLGVHTGLVVLAMAAMATVAPTPGALVYGAALLAVGNLFFEFASVNYNAMLVQVSTKKTIGSVSGFGWGMGYVGGIVLLVLLLLAFLQSFGVDGRGGLFGVATGTEGGAWDVRLSILVAAVWFAVFAVPVLLAVPEPPRTTRASGRGSVLSSYRALGRTIKALWQTNRQVLLFLGASAVFRDGLAAVFTFGAIIAAQVFGFTSAQVIYFAVAANLVAGLGTFAGGWLDDRIGSKRIIVGSLAGLVVACGASLALGTSQGGFWVVGLSLCLFVGPTQAASRTMLARVTPPGREGEIFGLYATTGRAVSFLAPGLFTLFVGATGDTRYGIVGIALVLLAGLLLMLPVKPVQRAID